MRGPWRHLSHDQHEWCAAVLTAVGEALPAVEFGSPTFMRPSCRALFTGCPRLRPPQTKDACHGNALHHHDILLRSALLSCVAALGYVRRRRRSATNAQVQQTGVRAPSRSRPSTSIRRRQVGHERAEQARARARTGGSHAGRDAERYADRAGARQPVPSRGRSRPARPWSRRRPASSPVPSSPARPRP